MSLYSQMMGNLPLKNNIVQNYQMLMNSNNPQQMLMSMMNNNPKMQDIMREVKANGGDARSLFLNKAKQMGVDPNTILNQLK